MMRGKVSSFLLRLRYLKLLAEIYILIAFNGFRKKLDFSKAKSPYPKRAAHFLPSYRIRQI
jgi:hypothetical protein